jgi:hypothetical protein
VTTTSQGSSFVDLDRQFMQVRERAANETAAEESYSRLSWWMFGPTVRWQELRTYSRVVVLGEAGSGKTSELQHQADYLTERGEFAFFVRLDELVRNSLELVLGSVQRERFGRWRDGLESASFFLDSVDESKIERSSDFYAALRCFRDAMPADFVFRTRMFLSARISEWEPEADSAAVERYFETPSRLDGLDDARVGLFVVHLAPLEWPEVSKLLTARGVAEDATFPAALHRATALEFMRRPIDVLALAELRHHNQEFGSLTELIEADLRQKLHERPSRKGDPLSFADSRAGAEALAAAAVFCKRSSFRVSSENRFIGALDGRVCVPPTWTDDQYAALLARPVFDCASRGAIRFHHRRVREYLAASWVATRMRDGCPIDELEQLFFERIGMTRIIRRSLAPIAVWLVAGNESWSDYMRQWLLEAAPAVHMQFGDPTRLSSEYKRRILRALVDVGKRDKAFAFDTDRDALSRFADPTLEADVEAIIQERAIPGRLLIEIVEMATAGKFRTCETVALDRIKSQDEISGVKVAAVNLIAALDDPMAFGRLRRIALDLAVVPERVTAALIDSLVPDYLDVADVWALLSRTQSTAHTKSGSRMDLSHSLRYRLPVQWTTALLNQTLKYLRKQTRSSLTRAGALPTTPDLMVAIIPDLLLGVMKEKQLREDILSDVVTAMRLASHTNFELHNKWDEVRKATEGNSTLRQRLFWDFVDRQKEEGPDGLVRIWRMLPVWGSAEDPDIQDLMEQTKKVITLFDFGVPSEHTPPFEFVAEDHVWLTAESGSATSDPVLAKALGDELFRRVKANASRERIKSDHIRAERARAIRHHRRPVDLRNLSLRNMHIRLSQWVIGLLEKIDAHFFLYWHLWRAKIDNDPAQYPKLLSMFSGQNVLRDRVIQKLAQVYWNRVSSRLLPARVAVARNWRPFTPPIPRQKYARLIPSYRAMIAAAGIQAAFKEGFVSETSLTTEDVRRMTVCAVNSPLWTFHPWFAWLATHRADEVDNALAECITLEWEWGAESSDLLEKLEDLQFGIKTQSAILAKLSEPGCISIDSSTWGVDSLLSQKSPPLDELRKLARKRVEREGEDVSLRGFWFATWVRVDVDEAAVCWEVALSRAPDAHQLLTIACANLASPTRHSRDRGRWAASQIARLILLISRHAQEAHHARKSRNKNNDSESHKLDESAPLEFRETLCGMLAQEPTPEATEALEAIASDPVLQPINEYLVRLQNEQLSRRADCRIWRPEDIRAFEEMHEIEPVDDYALFRIGLKRLSDIKNDVERSDAGLRTHLRAGDNERLLRIWLGNELMRRANRRYMVPQEAVIDQEQRPDLRLEHPQAGTVSIEVKWAQDWSPSRLMRGLEDQLSGKYLRAHNSRCGIYVVATARRRRWKTDDGHEMDFSELIQVLKSKAQEIVLKDRSRTKQLAVVGIDFREPNSDHVS